MSEKLNYISFTDVKVPYTIRASTRAKRLQMRFKNQIAEVVVPPRTPERTVQRFIIQNSEWLKKQYLHLKQHANLFWPDNFLPGQHISFQGEKIILDLALKDGQLTKIDQDRFQVSISPTTPVYRMAEAVRQEVVAHLKQQAAQKAKIYCQAICSRLGRWPKSLKIRATSSRWGSCGIHQDIYLNWVLILAPKFVFEYVVLHECCHLFYRSHGVRFWQKVADDMPNYKKAEVWLRKYGSHLAEPV